MGAYFHYVNETARERFSIGALGDGVKRSSIGFTLAARAFELMLIPPEVDPSDRGLLGAWYGDRVAVASDQAESWDAFDKFEDIGANVLVMLFETDGFDDIADAARRNNDLFVQLGHLAETRQHEGIASAFRDEFGPESHALYAERAACSYSQPLNLVLRRR